MSVALGASHLGDCRRTGKFFERQYAIMADIAAEAWSKASARWAERNGSPPLLQSERGYLSRTENA